MRVTPGETAIISGFSDPSAERLRYLGQSGLYPGTTVQVQALTEDRMVLLVAENVVAIDMKVTVFVFVKEDG
ncbi:MAG: ferrous iron transport protein A [Chloroflexi bacterium]|nr:ferrous iron transport protein A [Chloroflexota bacterium]